MLVYINGQTQDKAKFFTESRLEVLNEAVKNEFLLNKPVKYFFTCDGKLVLIKFQLNKLIKTFFKS